MKIGVFLPNWIGDVAMATPTLRFTHALWAGGGDCRHPATVRTRSAGRHRLAGPHDRLPAKVSRPAITPLRVAARLRSEQFDTVIVLTNSLRQGCWPGIPEPSSGRAMFATVGPSADAQALSSACGAKIFTDAGDRCLSAAGLCGGL